MKKIKPERSSHDQTDRQVTIDDFSESNSGQWQGSEGWTTGIRMSLFPRPNLIALWIGTGKQYGRDNRWKPFPARTEGSYCSSPVPPVLEAKTDHLSYEARCLKQTQIIWLRDRAEREATERMQHSVWVLNNNYGWEVGLRGLAEKKSGAKA